MTGWEGPASIGAGGLAVVDFGDQPGLPPPEPADRRFQVRQVPFDLVAGAACRLVIGPDTDLLDQ